MKESSLDLLLSPSEVLRINDAHRRYDVGGADLWTADDVYTAEIVHVHNQYDPMKDIWPFESPCVYNSRYTKVVNQSKYNTHMKNKKSAIDVQKVLALTNESLRGSPVAVVLAGGAAAEPYFTEGSSASDSDLFITGADPADDATLWGTVRTILEKIDEVDLASHGPGRTRKNMVTIPGLVRILIENNDRSEHEIQEIQIILRAYPSISSVLHGFDIGSCCVAYDGSKTFLTTMGAFAQVYSANIVNPRYRSTTYEHRLNKYFRRGYGLSLVHLNPEKLKVNKNISLAHMIIYIKKVIYTAKKTEENKVIHVAEGCIKHYEFAKSDNLSDYGSEDKFYNGYGHINKYIMDLSELLRSNYEDAQIKNEFFNKLLTGSTTYKWPSPRTDQKLSDMFKTPPEKLSAVLSNEEMNICLEKSLKTHSLVIKDTNPKSLNKSIEKLRQLKIPESYIKRILAIYYKLDRPLSQFELIPILSKSIKTVQGIYNEVKNNTIEWWIKVDPGRQFTSSLNPIVEDPRDWYCGRNDDNDLYIETPSEKRLVFEDKVITKDEKLCDCPICLMPIYEDDKNVVTLECGHKMHYSIVKTKRGEVVCGGLKHWLDNNSTCPVCRTEIE